MASADLSLLKDSLNDIGTSDKEDLLGQGPALQTVLTAIGALPPPGCIALYGAWGSGKSTLLHNAKQRWSDQHGPAVWFDPWMYERQDDVLTPMLHTILRELDLGKDGSERLKNLAVGIAKTLLSLTSRIFVAHVSAGASEAAKTLLAPLVESSPKDFEPHFEKWSAFQDEVLKTQENFAELVKEALSVRTRKGQPDERLVVFLDDLDRCLPDQVVQLIEGIKLLLLGQASDAKVVFAFALDRQIVGEAIRARYPDSTLYTGENYLEKIFDVSLEVPAVQPERLNLFLGHLIGEDRHQRLAEPLTSQEMKGADLLQAVLTNPVFANPRVIKRVVNRMELLFAHKKVAAEIDGLWDADIYRRLVLWIAGAERFRTFRHYYFVASEAELKALGFELGLTKDTADARNTPSTVVSLLAQPGFRAYAQMLFATEDDLTRLRDINVPGSLAKLDRMLRSAGL